MASATPRLKRPPAPTMPAVGTGTTAAGTGIAATGTGTGVAAAGGAPAGGVFTPPRAGAALLP